MTIGRDPVRDVELGAPHCERCALLLRDAKTRAYAYNRRTRRRLEAHVRSCRWAGGTLVGVSPEVERERLQRRVDELGRVLDAHAAEQEASR